MKKRLAVLKSLCSYSQFRIIRQFLHNCYSEYYDFIYLHKRKKLEKLRQTKPLRQSPMDDKLVVSIPMNLPLSSSEMSILKQGLSFIYTAHTVDEFEIRCDFDKFARCMRLLAHFDENPVKEQSQPFKDITTYTFNDPFERLKPKTSSWTPPEGQHPSLDVFISKCRIDINNILNNHITSIHSNTSSEDRNAIKRLQERKYIVIKQADKGGAIVVWRLDLYFQEAILQISNTDFYYPIENDPTPHQQDIIPATVAEIISEKCLPNSATNLIQDNPKCSMFYILPKIHKVDNPGRPIVTTINCPTELNRQYLDDIFFPYSLSCQLSSRIHLMSSVNAKTLNLQMITNIVIF